MSEYTPHRLHPDADSLSAFIEGVLPEHERLECLAHLSECAQCREIVFLAQEPVTAEAPAPIAVDPVPLWKRWFTPIPVFSTAAVVCSIVILTAVFWPKKQTLPAPVLTSFVSPPAEIPPAPVLSLPAPAAAKIALPPLNVKSPEPVAELKAASPGVIGGVPPALTAPKAAPFAPRAAGGGGGVLGGILGGLPAAPPPALASVSGSVTDTAGAVISGATVTLRSITGTAAHDARTDAQGQFNIAGLAPGPYEMRIASPGFNQTSQRIDLPPRQVEMANSVLQVGSQAEAVTVEATPALASQTSATLGSVTGLNTEASALPLTARNYTNVPALSAGPALVLPNKSTATTSARNDKRIVAADSSGTLFFSNNAGKSWKSVKAVWPGKIINLSVTPDASAPANQVFQLTTDSSAIWLSRDGSHWSPKK